MAHESTEATIRLARVIAAPPEQVVSELEEYGKELSKQSFGLPDKALEQSLLDRDDALINLSLARYGGDKDVVAALYARSFESSEDPLQERYSNGLRIACLANESVATTELLSRLKFPVSLIGQQEFERLIDEGDDDELLALFSNPKIGDQHLVNLYERTSQFAQLPEERWRKLVACTQPNPRLVTDSSSRHGPDLGYSDIHKAVIQMLASVPTTEENFWLMKMIIDAIDPFHPGGNPGESLVPILERWRTVRITDSNEEARAGNYTSLPLVDEFCCQLSAIYGSYVKQGKKYYETHYVGSERSDDIARRCAFYGNADLTEKQMRSGYARDGDAYTYAVLFNSSVIRSPKLRKLLTGEQLSGDQWYLYDNHCKELNKRDELVDFEIDWDSEKEDSAPPLWWQRYQDELMGESGNPLPPLWWRRLQEGLMESIRGYFWLALIALGIYLLVDWLT